MGRIFLAPPTQERAELWVNIGWHDAASQSFPDWIQELEPACSREQYDALVADLKEYFKSNSIGFWVSELSSVFFCLIIPLLIIHHKRRKIQNDVCMIIETHRALLRSSDSLHFEVVEQATTIPRSKKAIDQHGAILEAAVGSGNVGSRLQAVWPPLGYNLIFRLPEGEHMQDRWPPPAPMHDGALPVFVVSNEK